MALWNRKRRQRAGPAAPTGVASADDAREHGIAPATTPSGTALRGDWDGGWRRVAPPVTTISRDALGLSDGLRFRSGLAAWQNPAFGTGLGHALLPSAPPGLIHGVARPPAPRTASPATPLLLRAAPRTPDPQTEPGQEPESGNARPRAAHPPGPAAPGKPGTPSGTSVARPAAVRPVAPRPSLIVARRPAAPVRRLAVVPPTEPPPQTGRPSHPAPAVGGPSRSAPTPTAGDPTGTKASAVGATAPHGGSPLLPAQEQPTPPVQRRARSGADHPGPQRPGPPDVESAGERHPVRPGLGAPLGALPADALPSPPSAVGPDIQRAPSAPMPVVRPPVERSEPMTSEAPSAGSTPPARPADGAPPPSAPPGDEPSGPRRPTRVQRAGADAPRATGPTGPRRSTGLGAPLPALPPTATTGDTAALRGDPTRNSGTGPSRTHVPDRRDHSAPADAERRAVPSADPAASAVRAASRSGLHGGPAGPREAAASGTEPVVRLSAAAPTAAPPVQRAAALLGERPLGITTPQPDALPASLPASAHAPLPVVPVTWRRQHAAVGTEAPVDTATAPTGTAAPQVQRRIGRSAPAPGTPVSGTPAPDAPPRGASTRGAPSPGASASGPSGPAAHRAVPMPRGQGNRPPDTPVGELRTVSLPAPSSGGFPSPHGSDVNGGHGPPVVGRSTSATPLGPGPGDKPAPAPDTPVLPHVPTDLSTAVPRPPCPPLHTPPRPSGAPPASGVSRTEPDAPAALALQRAPHAGGSSPPTGRPAPSSRAIPVVRPAPPKAAGSALGAALPSAAGPVPREGSGPDPVPGVAAAAGQVPPAATEPARAHSARSARAVQRAPASGGDTALPVVHRPGRAAERGVPPEHLRRPGPGGRPQAGVRPASGGAARAVALQRMEEAGLTGVPVTPVVRSAASADASDAEPSNTERKNTRGAQGQEGIAGIDVEELARRLLDPVSRLLRADLRRDRERAGRLYDRRR